MYITNNSLILCTYNQGHSQKLLLGDANSQQQYTKNLFGISFNFQFLVFMYIFLKPHSYPHFLTFSNFFNVQILAHFQQKNFNKKLDIFFVVATASREGKKRSVFFFFFRMVSSKGGMRDETNECFVLFELGFRAGLAVLQRRKKIKSKLHIQSLFYTSYFNLIPNLLIVTIWSLTFQYHVNLVLTIIFQKKIDDAFNGQNKKLAFVNVTIH